MIDPLFVGLVSASTALVASIAGPLITLHVGRSQIRAAVLSANRQRWIDGLRELVATFCSQVAVAVQVRERLLQDGKLRLEGAPDVAQFERIVLTFTKIQLMINPLETDHRLLLDAMKDIVEKIRRTPTSVDIEPEVEAGAQRIVEIAQSIFKREWVRVKRGT